MEPRKKLVSISGRILLKYSRRVPALWQCQQTRSMGQSGYIVKREPRRLVRTFENMINFENYFSAAMHVINTIKREPDHVIELRELPMRVFKKAYRDPRQVFQFMTAHTDFFETFRDRHRRTWVGFTPAAEALIEEEKRIRKAYEPTAVDSVRKLLMMARGRSLEVQNLSYFREELLLPDDFHQRWTRKFPEYFRVVQKNGKTCMELTSWDASLAITALEKQAMEAGLLEARNGNGNENPGLLKLPFPLKFPSSCYRNKGQWSRTEEFQELEYLSPYAGPSDMKIGEKETEKRIVAVLHEILSLTFEKRSYKKSLSFTGYEFGIPRKLEVLLLKHHGIFYVPRKGKKYSVFLTNAYDHYELIERTPFSEWKEKVADLLVRTRRERKKQGLFTYCRSFKSRDRSGKSDNEYKFIEARGRADQTAVRSNDSQEMQIDDILKEYECVPHFSSEKPKKRILSINTYLEGRY